MSKPTVVQCMQCMLCIHSARSTQNPDTNAMNKCTACAQTAQCMHAAALRHRTPCCLLALKQRRESSDDRLSPATTPIASTTACKCEQYLANLLSRPIAQRRCCLYNCASMRRCVITVALSQRLPLLCVGLISNRFSCSHT